MSKIETAVYREGKSICTDSEVGKHATKSNRSFSRDQILFNCKPRSANVCTNISFITGKRSLVQGHKIQNSIFSVIFTFLFATSALSTQSTFAAEAEKKAENSKVGCAKEANDAVKYHLANGGKFKTDKEKSDFYGKAIAKCYGGGDEDTCKTAQKDFLDLKGKFASACSKANISGGGKAGSIACSAQIAKCLDAGAIESSMDEDSDMPYDTEQMAEQKEMCPAKLANGKELKEELKETKEEVKELDDKIDELEEEQMTAGNSVQSEILDMQDQANQAQQQCVQQQKELERAIKDKKKEIQDQVAQMNSQILSLNDQISEMESSKVQAAIAYNQEIAKLELQCHAYAIDKVNKNREILLAKVANGTLNHGDFNAVMNKTGKSSRKVDQEEAFRHYTNCINSDTTNKPKIAARDNYNFAASVSERQIQSFKAQREEAHKQIGVLMNNETARADMEGQQDRIDAQNACSQNLDMMKAKMFQKQADGAAAKKQAATKLAKAKAELDIAKGRERNIMAAARLSSGGASSSADFAEAMSAGTSLESSAENFRLTCCAIKVDGMEGTCNETASYLASLGKSVATTASADVPVTLDPVATPAPAATPSPAPQRQPAAPPVRPGGGDDARRRHQEAERARANERARQEQIRGGVR